ncbi:hypothetical protein [Pedobacter ginsengisoli]|uniref:hypothetical protein n=1 Tax=Pedobacter ginsengisoli TaxID=363852 RepID=UPI00254C6495|nr:hypothetical protein [Pedobacter ginsengisoli]
MSVLIKKSVLLQVASVLMLLLVTNSSNAQVIAKRDTAVQDTGLRVSVKLKQVNIMGFRNTRLDSLSNRIQFANVFNHKAPGLTDLFSQKVSYNNRYSAFQSSTSSLVGINLLSLPGLLGKKKNPVERLKRNLLKEEETAFVDRVFSKSLISSVTHLQGDSLQLFQTRYRPGFATAKQTTAYDMMLYIKKCLKDFKGH